WCETATEGMRITAVVPGGPADVIGLQRGDTLVKIDDQRLRSNADLVRALRNARGLVTITYRHGATDRPTRIEVGLARGNGLRAAGNGPRPGAGAERRVVEEERQPPEAEAGVEVFQETLAHQSGPQRPPALALQGSHRG